MALSREDILRCSLYTAQKFEVGSGNCLDCLLGLKRLFDGHNFNLRKLVVAVYSLGAGSGGQYCRNNVGCMGCAVMPSDEEPEEFFARGEWARDVVGVGPGGLASSCKAGGLVLCDWLDA